MESESPGSRLADLIQRPIPENVIWLSKRINLTDGHFLVGVCFSQKNNI